MFSKEELIKMLKYSGIEYDMDSSTPGIQYEDGSFETYAEVQLPSEYLKEYEQDVAYPSLTVHVNNRVVPSTYNFTENIYCDVKYFEKNNIQDESLGFAA
nr:hypothetical protein [Streptococcus lutetiensis]